MKRIVRLLCRYALFIAGKPSVHGFHEPEVPSGLQKADKR